MLAMLMFFSLISLWRIAGSAKSYNKLNGLRHFIHKVQKKLSVIMSSHAQLEKEKKLLLTPFGKMQHIN